MNKTMNEKNKKTIRKMNKYINTFPLDDQAILQIQQDIEGMAQEAQEREEPLEQIIGKDPREFCDDLIYAVGGIKTPGGRKMLRIAGADIWVIPAYFILGCIPAIMYIIGARRNRPHTEEAI